MPAERLLPLLAGTAVLAATVALAGPPQTARTDELARLLVQDCGSCHGMRLTGGLGAPLLPESLAGKDRGALADVVLDGIPGTPMPPWRGLLTREDALWIVDRLISGKTQ